MQLYIIPMYYFDSKNIKTAQACAIVAEAAALVLEKYPDYSPAEVKQHPVNESMDGMLKMDALTSIQGDKGANKLLYVGTGMCISKLVNLHVINVAISLHFVDTTLKHVYLYSTVVRTSLVALHIYS